MKIFTEEIRDFIVAHAKGTGNAALTEMVNDTFGTEITELQIKTFKKNNKISSGLTGHFPKGHATHNKGMKGIVYAGSEKGWFKSGNTPHNHRQVGSERIKVDGYIEVKIAEPNKWQQKQVLTWEAANGKVPKGSVVVMLDGNKLNTSIENLKMITRSELLIMNNHGFFKKEAELTNVGSNIAKLIDAKNKRRKKKRRKGNESKRMGTAF